ncbi:imm11 family protein [Vitiosangium sp. GDMCC 1.1324]|uniref:imm11 family protein n=1 Tax=Vitiosangium sp. (strain GDMCC 1.1324) TaxID=2138576 RepID=UPI001E31FADF|nr:DUF1629 domain-containing protein [Vitiosangium sp. GDMCC 1.1324]
MTWYYDLLDDTRLPGRWQLGAPLDDGGNEIDPWQFKKGRVLELGCVPRFTLDLPGHPLDFSWAAFSIPVVSGRFAKLFERLRVEGVQFIKAQVDDQPEPWYILNALRIIRCIDDARSEQVQYWKPQDNRPDKLGEYRAVYGMRIDSAKVGDARIFRPWGWRVALIVAGDIKQAIEDTNLSGARFVEV